MSAELMESFGVGMSFIDRIENKSDPSLQMTRMRIFFKNGLGLSVVQGPYSYGGDKGLFEIMPSGGEDDQSLFDEEDEGDTVLGYLTAERVKYYINKIGNY